ncbi:uncharacterized protein TRIREDRAFT_121559 [Trichoderma reesei QM6a]|uniref:Predicted protein n=2 Tax=Hypocrea jecorina TaxID=51453 RepID=G0RHY1_HYPJQ|nr:uncharacterized protein TRIREDRAFT_121559 [Trichoderma reesei QM6a]EGR48885.1 predicted protein [Trichoderma reesei QM6a]ETS02623.1 hypothetical protein M419DRAFT_35143 [Trichoderma reesei RUT C-30]
MPGGAPGSSSRGRGGKFRKFTRGGKSKPACGKHFSRNLQPLDAEGNAVSMWGEDAQLNKDESDSEEESEEESDAEDEEEEQGGSSSRTAAAQASAEANREDRKAQKKARKEAAIAKQKSRAVEVGDMPSSSDEESDADLPANPNHSSSARKQASKAAADVDAITEGVKKLPASRREREAAEAAAAKERYMKLHAEGKTDEAKADIARLKAIRAQREADAARRQAEKEEKEERERERRAEIEAREAKLRALAAGPKKSSKKK